MTIDSPATVLTALAVAVLATGLLALVWDRRRVLGRIALVAGVVLAVSGTAALQLNSLVEAYPSWSSLFSQSVQADDGGDGKQPTGGLHVPPPSLKPGQIPGRGRTVSVVVPGPASGMTMPMTVYLPAAYDTPAGQHLRFPVIQAAHGYPGTPEAWLRRLDIVGHLDREIAAGRMAPTVVLLPYQTTDHLLDTECTNLKGGPQAETYLTRDVRQWAVQNLRVRTDQAGWGLIGYSAGGYCAMNLATKHPELYAAGASLSGDSEPGIKVGDGSEKTTNSVTWRLTHRPPPPVALYIAWSADEQVARLGSQRVVKLAKAPLLVTTATVSHGGHSHNVWRQMEGPAFDWLSANLARPLRSDHAPPGHLPPPGHCSPPAICHPRPHPSGGPHPSGHPTGTPTPPGPAGSSAPSARRTSSPR